MPINKRWSEEEVPAEQLTSWRQLLAEQAGIVSLSQLRAHGLGLNDVEANVEGLRWQRVLPRVYATFTGELSRPARLHAALLYGGANAVLSHHTAAEEWGMLPVEDRPVEVTVPYTSSAISQLPLVRVHRSRAIRHSVLETFPPRTKRTDTVLDLAVAQSTPQDAKRLVIDLMSRHAVSMTAMLACVELRPPMRYRSTIKHALELVRSGLMSALEVEYVEQVEEAHGLPVAQRQVPQVVDGRTLWEDFAYAAHGVRLTVRLDGRRDHATPGIAFRDMRRDNAAELAGRSRLVYGWNDVSRNPCAVAAEVRAVLVRAGWQPPASAKITCSRCSAFVSG